MHLHQYRSVRSVRSHAYEACQRCGRRRIVYLMRGGYFPVDRNWLATGVFTQPRPPVQSPSASVHTPSPLRRGTLAATPFKENNDS